MKPYKCPVCDGEGKRAHYTDDEILDALGVGPIFMGFKKCNPCNGKGIVWNKKEK